jgi:hypothetical protein
MSRSAHVVDGDRVYGAWDMDWRKEVLDYSTAADTFTDALHVDRPPVDLRRSEHENPSIDRFLPNEVMLRADLNCEWEMNFKTSEGREG